ncbi:MAG: hypothetical protein GY926_22195, partial [bacterium]|nr:hypothetical protein [bacterium]
MVTGALRHLIGFDTVRLAEPLSRASDTQHPNPDQTPLKSEAPLWMELAISVTLAVVGSVLGSAALTALRQLSKARGLPPARRMLDNVIASRPSSHRIVRRPIGALFTILVGLGLLAALVIGFWWAFDNPQTVERVEKDHGISLPESTRDIQAMRDR